MQRCMDEVGKYVDVTNPLNLCYDNVWLGRNDSLDSFVGIWSNLDIGLLLCKRQGVDIHSVWGNN